MVSSSLLFPSAVTAGATLEAIAVASAAVAATLVVVLIGRHGLITGAAMLVLAMAGMVHMAQ